MTVYAVNESGGLDTLSNLEAYSLYGLTYDLSVNNGSIDTSNYSSVTYLDELQVTYTETYKYAPGIELSDVLAI